MVAIGNSVVHYCFQGKIFFVVCVYSVKIRIGEILAAGYLTQTTFQSKTNDPIQ